MSVLCLNVKWTHDARPKASGYQAVEEEHEEEEKNKSFAYI